MIESWSGRTRTIRRLAAVGAMLLLFSSCNSGSDELSLEEYGRLVEEAGEEQSELQEEILSAEEASLDEIEELFVVNEALIEEMETISPPEEVQVAHRSWLETGKEVQGR